MFRLYRKMILFLLDISIIITTINSTYFIMFHIYRVDEFRYTYLLPHIAIFIVILTVMQCLFGTYRIIWRYARSKEYLTMLLGGAVGFIIYIIIDYVLLNSVVPIITAISTLTISLLGMLFMRLCYRHYIYCSHKACNKSLLPIVIIGAGDAGVKLYEEIESNPNNKYKVLFFVDDDHLKISKKIHKIEVKGPISNLENLLQDTNVKEIIIAIPSMSANRQREILNLCSKLPYKIQILPNTLAILQSKTHGSLLRRIRDINTEELLDREPVNLTGDEIREFLSNKIIMVTGGGGSIGSELCRQISNASVKQLIILDIYENNAYEIQQELIKYHGDNLDLKIEIASIRDKAKINQLVEHYRPNIIFHAAAHKHVPLMEECPEEAILNNIFGTYNVVQAAERYHVDKFVLISTDKAVNPTSVMGASKRFCEMILQSKKNNSETEFVAVRFGNVLGSNGSVIPLFQKQIAQGGPVTITDKRIVRFFMTINEATELVLQAGAIANSSEIYVLDMGEQVKIIDLAENLIQLSGYVPYVDIPIVEIGLRPGEKLYEELLTKGDNLVRTTNQKIYIEQQDELSHDELDKSLKILSGALKTNDRKQIVEALKQVVPTYKSPEEVNNNYDIRN